MVFVKILLMGTYPVAVIASFLFLMDCLIRRFRMKFEANALSKADDTILKNAEEIQRDFDGSAANRTEVRD